MATQSPAVWTEVQQRRLLHSAAFGALSFRSADDLLAFLATDHPRLLVTAAQRQAARLIAEQAVAERNRFVDWRRRR